MLKSTLDALFQSRFNSGFELYIESGAEQGRFIALESRHLKMGRMPSYTPRPGWICFDDVTISSHHVTLLWDSSQNTYRLLHQSKTNPTLVNGKVADKTLLHANDQIRMGNLVLRVMEGTRQPPLPKVEQLRKAWAAPPNPYLVSLFFTHLSALLGAGVTLIRSLEVLQKQADDAALGNLLLEIISDVYRGTPFSTALNTHRTYFSGVSVGVIKAGESSGQLPLMLGRVALATEKDLRLRQKIKNSLIYPLFVLVVGIGVLGVLCRYAFVQLVPLLMSSKVPLPSSTRVLIDLSNLSQSPLVMFLGVLAVLCLAALGRVGWANPRCRTALDDLSFRLPLIGRLRMSLAASRFCTNLALLCQAGIPLVGALERVEATTGERRTEKMCRDVSESIRQGATFADSLRVHARLPVAVISMVEVGEASGELAGMLDRTGQWLAADVDEALEQLVSAIEPATVVLLGLFVGFIAIAGFVPIYQAALSLT